MGDGQREAWERESTWQSLAIAATVLLAIGVVCSWIWIIEGDLAEKQQKVAVLTPFGALAAAVITFFTVMWRGLINQRQADAQITATNLQREQIEKLSEQLSETNENNLALLLQKGAELLAEPERDAKVAAGVAILQSVATAPSGKFAVEAMDLLTGFLLHKRKGSIDEIGDAAIQALFAASELGRYSRRSLRLTDEIEGKVVWPRVRGPKSVHYRGGRVHGRTLDAEGFGLTRTRYIGVQIIGSAVELDRRFTECTFVRCRILRILDASALRLCSFVDCNFTNAQIETSDFAVPDLKSKGNYFYPPDPPRGGRRDWSQYLSARVEREFDFEDLE